MYTSVSIRMYFFVVVLFFVLWNYLNQDLEFFPIFVLPFNTLTFENLGFFG